MKPPTISLSFFLLFTFGLVLEASKNGCNGGLKREDAHIKRSDFPPGFLFGASTSAYQVEGAYLEDAKSLSNWDAFCHSVTGCGKNGDNGDIADDHYHRFLKDIEMMHSLGVQAYRFSISWARILPRGRSGEVNPAGIMFYNKIIDNLILKGIEPFVTIFHNDFPQELEDKYGSWLNPEMKEEFVHMAEICFKSFGDRVKHWITINEPNVFTIFAYELGLFPPSRCSEPLGHCVAGNSDVEPLIVMHNLLLAHGMAAKLYHENFKAIKQLLTLLSFFYAPTLTNLMSELDRKAAKRGLAFNIGWSLDPVIFGEYPKEMREYLGTKLPSFSEDEKNFLKNSSDFIGINHYSTTYTKDCTNSSCSPIANRAFRGFLEMVEERDGVPIGEPTKVKGLPVVPRGMGEIVNYIKIRYNNKPMFITENGRSLSYQIELINHGYDIDHDLNFGFVVSGYSSPDVPGGGVKELVNDVKRVKFHEAYLASLAKSIREGADVRGYFIWSLMDNYEWLQGYDVKFGLHYVDRHTLTRVPKLSAKWSVVDASYTNETKLKTLILRIAMFSFFQSLLIDLIQQLPSFRLQIWNSIKNSKVGRKAKVCDSKSDHPNYKACR
ncbi:hypothetical protein OSB04_005326 [Centaurea solstitialis]|uniref:Uncharacterized protein n=1 Tax=Centaurea solstitialis TaxID=347529 RepID=A0AA38WS15_9ASTR|nr:hypothetical protein OSB04_005326 [Centaurea solstitialis]